MVYRVSTPSAIQTVDDLRSWAEGELQALEQDLSEADFLRLRPLAREPVKPREGTVVYADGVNWNPGAGEGPYVYKDGAWTSFALGASANNGLWDPEFSFDTPGNLSVVYSTQSGTWARIGKLVSIQFVVTTSTFTHTTASGSFRLKSLPFNGGSGLDGLSNRGGAFAWGGFTLAAGYTSLALSLPSGQTSCQILASGSGLGLATLDTTNVPSGGTVTMRGEMTYLTDDP